MPKKSPNTLKPPSRCIVSCLGTLCYPLHIYFTEKLEKIQISESGQPDGGISHLKRGNPLLHIVGREGVGLNLKIRPRVENFFSCVPLRYGRQLGKMRISLRHPLLSWDPWSWTGFPRCKDSDASSLVYMSCLCLLNYSCQKALLVANFRLRFFLQNDCNLKEWMIRFKFSARHEYSQGE